MDIDLKLIQTEIYDKCALEISDFMIEEESKEYDACQYNLNGRRIISRTAKITPKKTGQFVTFWKRQGIGPIRPFCEKDQFDLYVVNVRAENKIGQFVFPKSVLINKGIISTARREGKRAFRVYPSWDATASTQAERTQQWQLEYFFEIIETMDFNKIAALYSKQ
ncbi:MAG TPA: MepB family protein [Lunatimonas sp.]|nr:MepB family protein [Lunatimonas sp.]